MHVLTNMDALHARMHACMKQTPPPSVVMHVTGPIMKENGDVRRYTRAIQTQKRIIQNYKDNPDL